MRAVVMPVARVTPHYRGEIFEEIKGREEKNASGLLKSFEKSIEEAREGRGNKQRNHLPSSDGREVYDGEFDPGSERTLAARFKHASRTVNRCLHWLRVANG